MSNGIEWLVGAFLLGIIIGVIISNDVSALAIETTPKNSIRAAIAFNQPALPR